ncbi:hypothetical protein S83_005748 [Arachis hypogaea]
MNSEACLLTTFAPPLDSPKSKAFHYISWCCSCLLARGPRWFARDESEQTWIKPN